MCASIFAHPLYYYWYEVVTLKVSEKTFKSRHTSSLSVEPSVYKPQPAPLCAGCRHDRRLRSAVHKGFDVISVDLRTKARGGGGGEVGSKGTRKQYGKLQSMKQCEARMTRLEDNKRCTGHTTPPPPTPSPRPPSAFTATQILDEIATTYIN